ncbi:MAG TPA: hypothetical protein VIS74_01735, partial [Chthoniobacterales bacterium]
MKISPYFFGLACLAAAWMSGFSGCATAPLAQPDAAHRISEKGIGPIRLGMTSAQVQAALGPGYRIASPARGNTLQLAAWHRVLNAGNQEVFRFFVSDWRNPGRPSPIIRVRTTQGDYRTAEGIGPGAPIPTAVNEWGAAQLRR